MRQTRTCWAFVVPLIGAASVEAQVCYGPGDLDGDSTAGAADFAMISGCFGGVDVEGPPAGCAPAAFIEADLDADGDVDLHDYSLFTLAFGEEYFDYAPYREDEEAEWLAIVLSGELRAPDEEYERIHRDLALIRAEYPQLSTVVDSPDYHPKKLGVWLIEGMAREGYDALNRFFQVVSDRTFDIVPGYQVLTFCGSINARALEQIYEDLPEVEDAYPQWFINLGAPRDIDVTRMDDVYIYTFRPAYSVETPGLCLRVHITGTDSAGAVISIFCMDSCGLYWCPL